VTERKHGLIYFGEGSGRWRVVDIENPAIEKACDGMTKRQEYAARQALCDYQYLLVICPTTREAQKKLAQIRRALRETTNPAEVEPSE
jgi:hypothetical protein